MDPRHDATEVMYPVIGTRGMKGFPADLESLDSVTLTQLRAAEQSDETGELGSGNCGN